MNLTNQEIFDMGCQHILTQGLPSINEHGMTVYYNHLGMKSIAGFFIPEDKYQEILEVHSCNELFAFHPEFNVNPKSVIWMMERHHDEFARHYLKYENNSIRNLTNNLISLARSYDLQLPEILQNYDILS